MNITITHDLASARVKLATYPPLLREAMYDASDEGTRIIASQLERTVVERTKMDPGMVHNMVEVEFGPAPGLIAKGEVSFSKPPEWIYPKKSKALRFTIGGRVIFAKRVRGSRPYPLVRRAATIAEDPVKRNFRRAIEGVFR